MTPARALRLLALSLFALSAAPSVLASNTPGNRDVQISFVEGDVRLSRGHDNKPDLNRPWELALAGEPVEQGFALATGNGRAEISFEDGSTVFLAENSLLLFSALSAKGTRTSSFMVLPTGTATFNLSSASYANYFIETPTEDLSLPGPGAFYARLDAYFDATAITYQSDPAGLSRLLGQKFPAVPGQTVFLQAGTVVNPAPPPYIFPLFFSIWNYLPDPFPDSFRLVAGFRSAQIWLDPSQVALRSAASSHAAWDTWVTDRVEHENAVMPAALKASGLSTPIPGLVELYDDGTFFDCGKYGTCWEPKDLQADAADARQSPAPLAQSPVQNPANPGFQPRMVSWEELSNGWCGEVYRHTVSRLARTPKELQDLLLQKALAESGVQTAMAHRPRYPFGPYSADCYSEHWLFRRGRYVKVIKPHQPPKCVSGSCHPKPRPHPVWVRVGKQVGFVPRHPDDAKGKPPLNLESGFLAPPSKQGEPARLIPVDSSEKISVLHAAPKEASLAASGLAVTAPEIRAPLLLAGLRQTPAATANHELSSVTYDYKSHSFVLPLASGSHSKPVAVGGISSRGTLGSFADGSSTRYASAFGRSSAASSYGGSYSAGGHGGGYSGGGGHSSGGFSGSSSGGSSGRSSGGGGGGRVSAGGGGGGSHH